MKVTAWPAYKTRYKNPYTWLLYSPMQPLGVEVEEFSPKLLLLNRYDVLHLHWPVETLVRHPNVVLAMLRSVLFLALIQWAKWRGTRVVWTIHDETPHVLLHPWLARWVEQRLIQQTDAYINLCQASQTLLSQKLGPAQLPAGGSHVIPHGHYQGVYPNQVSRQMARDQLDIAADQRVILFLGYISAYKNVPLLIQRFRALAREDVVLVVAGKPDDDDIAAQIHDAAQADSRVRLFLDFVPDERLQVFYNAADLVALPFRKILNSGSALLALSFFRPVLVPAQGAMVELQDKTSSAWVNLYDGELSTPHLEQAIQGIEAIEHWDRSALDYLDWQKISQQTLAVYRQAMA